MVVTKMIALNYIDIIVTKRQIEFFSKSIRTFYS